MNVFQFSQFAASNEEGFNSEVKEDGMNIKIIGREHFLKDGL